MLDVLLILRPVSLSAVDRAVPHLLPRRPKLCLQVMDFRLVFAPMADEDIFFASEPTASILLSYRYPSARDELSRPPGHNAPATLAFHSTIRTPGIPSPVPLFCNHAIVICQPARKHRMPIIHNGANFWDALQSRWPELSGPILRRCLGALGPPHARRLRSHSSTGQGS